MRILGISGRREAGKDTLASDLIGFLQHRFRVAAASTADWPKQVLLALGVEHSALWGTDAQKDRDVVRDLMNLMRRVNRYGLIDRVLMEHQQLGTQILLLPCVRNVEDIERIRDNGGLLIRLTRVLHPEDTYPEEITLDGRDYWDLVIDNAAMTPGQVAVRALQFLNEKGWFEHNGPTHYG